MERDAQTIDKIFTRLEFMHNSLKFISVLLIGILGVLCYIAFSV